MLLKEGRRLMMQHNGPWKWNGVLLAVYARWDYENDEPYFEYRDYGNLDTNSTACGIVLWLSEYVGIFNFSFGNLLPGCSAPPSDNFEDSHYNLFVDSSNVITMTVKDWECVDNLMHNHLNIYDWGTYSPVCYDFIRLHKKLWPMYQTPSIDEMYKSGWECFRIVRKSAGYPTFTELRFFDADVDGENKSILNIDGESYLWEYQEFSMEDFYDIIYHGYVDKYNYGKLYTNPYTGGYSYDLADNNIARKIITGWSDFLQAYEDYDNSNGGDPNATYSPLWEETVNIGYLPTAWYDYQDTDGWSYYPHDFARAEKQQDGSYLTYWSTDMCGWASLMADDNYWNYMENNTVVCFYLHKLDTYIDPDE